MFAKWYLLVFAMATQQQVMVFVMATNTHKWYLLVFVMATQQQVIFISVCYGYSTTSDIY